MPLELNIAWRYLRSRRGSRLPSLISVIAIGGVTVGVSALIVVMGVMNGLQRDLREKILVGSADIQVVAGQADLPADEWERVLREVRSHPGVVAASPFVTTQALINANHNYMDAGWVVGIPPEDSGAPDVTEIRKQAAPGAFRFASADGERRGVVLGKGLALRLGVVIGDEVTLYGRGNGEISAVTGQPTPMIARVQVTGIFETGLYQRDEAYMYVALPLAQELAGLSGSVTGIEIKARNRASARGLARELSGVLGNRYRFVDWQEQNRSLFQALQLEKLGMGVILLLIVLVAAFNIVSNLTMVVVDKTREIGILKAMGLESQAVRRIFVAQGLAIGLVGTALGVVLGIAVSQALGTYQFIKLDPEVYMIDHLPVATDVLDVLATIVASIGIAALATAYPSRQAARLYPIEAIRSE